MATKKGKVKFWNPKKNLLMITAEDGVDFLGSEFSLEYGEAVQNGDPVEFENDPRKKGTKIRDRSVRRRRS